MRFGGHGPSTQDRIIIDPMAEPPSEESDPYWKYRPENRPYSAEEEDYKATFPYLTMSPEEYVARKAHVIGAFSCHRTKLKDERLKAWLQRVFDLLIDRERLPALRCQFLTPEEVADIEAVGDSGW